MVRSLRPRATEGNAFERKGTSMPQVAYTRDNVEKCRCESCPVQVRSTCARDLYEVSEGSETLPLPAHLPGLYCSTGKTMCTDVTLVNLCKLPGMSYMERVRAGIEPLLQAGVCGRDRALGPTEPAQRRLRPMSTSSGRWEEGPCTGES